MATNARDLNTAEVAYAAVNEVRKYWFGEHTSVQFQQFDKYL